MIPGSGARVGTGEHRAEAQCSQEEVLSGLRNGGRFEMFRAQSWKDFPCQRRIFSPAIGNAAYIPRVPGSPGSIAYSNRVWLISVLRRIRPVTVKTDTIASARLPRIAR
jgi:hypothetical protein